MQKGERGEKGKWKKWLEGIQPLGTTHCTVLSGKKKKKSGGEEEWKIAMLKIWNVFKIFCEKVWRKMKNCSTLNPEKQKQLWNFNFFHKIVFIFWPARVPSHLPFCSASKPSPVTRPLHIPLSSSSKQLLFLPLYTQFILQMGSWLSSSLTEQWTLSLQVGNEAERGSLLATNRKRQPVTSLSASRRQELWGFSEENI